MTNNLIYLSLISNIDIVNDKYEDIILLNTSIIPTSDKHLEILAISLSMSDIELILSLIALWNITLIIGREKYLSYKLL